MYFDAYQSGKRPYQDSVGNENFRSPPEEHESHVMALFNVFMNMRRAQRSVATVERFLGGVN